MNEETPIPESTTQGKQRHGCLTAYLVVMIIANAAVAVMYLIGKEGIKQALPQMEDWVFPVLIGVGIFNLVCAIALFRWKKWGFWGFVASSCLMLVINLSIGLGIGQSIGGLVGVAVLYGVLQIGNEDKGWPQLD